MSKLSEIKILYCLLVLNLSRSEQEKILEIPNKFFSDEARSIFLRCKERIVNNELVDISVITEKDNKIAQKLMSIEAYGERLELYIKELKQDYLKRKLQLVTEAGTNEDMLNEINAVRDELLGETTTVKKMSLKNIVFEYYKNIENPPKDPIKTGWKKFDRLVQMQAEDLVIVAGRPGMGKTAFILSKALNIAKTGEKGIFFSLEMSERQIINRIMSQMSRVRLDLLKDRNTYSQLPDEAYGYLNIASAKLSELDEKLSFITGNFTVNKILEICKVEKEKNGLDYIIIDYMQLLGSSVKGSRYEQITDISISLKKLAKELGIVVIALAQLSRDVEKRADRRPQQSDLRDSGQIEQDASIIIGLYRDAYYNEDTEDPELLEVNVLKNRDGELGTIHFNFIGKIQEVTER
nr:MAG TPA: DnaB-like replicative helicase [Caudoviricetes sp.]